MEKYYYYYDDDGSYEGIFVYEVLRQDLQRPGFVKIKQIFPEAQDGRENMPFSYNFDSLEQFCYAVTKEDFPLLLLSLV